MIDSRVSGGRQLHHRAERRTVGTEQVVDHVVRTTGEGMHPVTALAHRSPATGSGAAPDRDPAGPVHSYSSIAMT